MTSEHPLWLGPASRALAGRTLAIVGSHDLAETVRADAVATGLTVGAEHDADILIAPAADAASWPEDDPDAEAAKAATLDLGPEGFVLVRRPGRTIALYGGAPAIVHAWFQLQRDAARATLGDDAGPVGVQRFEPDHELRILDHWDNVAVHPVMGQVERGYAGGSIFYRDGHFIEDLSRVERYARIVASMGINRVCINNVNVHEREARLLTDDLDGVARIAEIFRRWGIRTHLAVSFASPIVLGGGDSADPLDPAVQRWWTDAADAVYRTIPDFGGFLVKADSEGQPGPFAYGRDHADGANLLARALAPHGGIVHWRAFVYNHRQDWRDRTTDRARAAHDNFTPLDDRFDDNVILQVKYGPLDFQAREPVSPVIPAMRKTSVALELQVTQEYTGHQIDAVYLAPQWREILDFRPFGEEGPRLAEIVRGGIAAVANVGDDPFWTGHPLAQANLYAYGRLAWDATLDPAEILDEWIALTFDAAARAPLHDILDRSWETYESYTAPLGVCFMVNPHHHYGPSVDGYEYSPWGTYHFADRDGIGVDRTTASGTGFAGQYPEPWATRYESLETVPDELVLFFHHVPYTHRLHSGKTVIQHIYDTHFDGVERVTAMRAMWAEHEALFERDLFERVSERLDAQERSAIEWRDQINTYFLRKSGIPDEAGRTIY